MEKRQDQEIEKIIDVRCACHDDDEEECEECGGTGVITTMERVYPNEPHMAPIGEEPCPYCGSNL